MKRSLYLFLCVLLGVLISTIVHGVIEKTYITLLLTDYDTWSFGLTWDLWSTIHNVITVLLLIVGAVGGLFVGKRWWNIVYRKV
jgi:hypothetical protein